MSVLTQSALLTIGAYQRFVSPYKGFRCAHGVLKGSLSCSEYGKKVITRWGIWFGMGLLKRRLTVCRTAYRDWIPTPQTNEAKRKEHLTAWDCAVPGFECGLGCCTLSH